MNQSKRQYNKRSDYWQQFNKPKVEVSLASQVNEFEPELAGEPFYVSEASFFTSSASDEYSRVDS
jgi:hypothetical protein